MGADVSEVAVRAAATGPGVVVTAVAWVFVSLIGVLSVACVYAIWDAGRHPGRWDVRPSLDDRDDRHGSQS